MQNFSGEGNAIDLLGTALMRASGVLSALSACQDQSRGTFALGGPFVLQAVLALEGFVNDARTAYLELCAASEAAQVRQSPPERAVRHAPVHMQIEPADASVFVTQDAQQGTLPDFYEIRRTVQPVEQTSTSQRSSYPDGSSPLPSADVALSYDALLRKLTAAEVFAFEQAQTSEDRHNPLLPLLKSLRTDLERIRAA